LPTQGEVTDCNCLVHSKKYNVINVFIWLGLIIDVHWSSWVCSRKPWRGHPLSLASTPIFQILNNTRFGVVTAIVFPSKPFAVSRWPFGGKNVKFLLMQAWARTEAGLHRAIASYVCNQVMRYPDARQDFRGTVQSSQPLVDWISWVGPGIKECSAWKTRPWQLSRSGFPFLARVRTVSFVRLNLYDFVTFNLQRDFQDRGILMEGKKKKIPTKGRSTFAKQAFQGYNATGFC
jgi:hypothetical protein